MKDSFAAGLELLSDVVRNPAFNVEEIERQRQQTLSGLTVSNQDPDYVATTVFDRLVYGFHPYGLPSSGTPRDAGVDNGDDLHAFHERNFVPNNAILAVVGDVTADEAFANADRVLGSLGARKDLPEPTVTDPPPADPPRRCRRQAGRRADRDSRRSPRASAQSPRLLAMDLAIRILGGEGAIGCISACDGTRADVWRSGRHGQRWHEPATSCGYRHADRSHRRRAAADRRRVLPAAARTRKRPRTVGRAGLPDGKLSADDRNARRYRYADLNVLFYGLPLSELETYRERVNAITPEDIQRVARTYLHPDRLSVVLVGNAAGFVPQLKGLGFDSYDLVSLRDLDVTTADLHRPAAPAAPAARPTGPRD